MWHNIFTIFYKKFIIDKTDKNFLVGFDDQFSWFFAIGYP